MSNLPVTGVSSIRVCADGREICLTQEAWQARRREVFRRAGGRCECRECSRHQGQRCNRLLSLTLADAKDTGNPVMHCHHSKGRGLGGGKRDDRISALEASCPRCHPPSGEKRR